MEGQTQQIFQDVVGIIGRHARNKPALEKASRETDILKDLQVNSARFVDIVLDFEEKFGIEISDAAADKIVTVGDAVDLVSKEKH